MQSEQVDSQGGDSTAARKSAIQSKAKRIGVTVGALYALFAWWGVGVVINCGGDMCVLVAVPLAFLMLPSSILLNFIPPSPPHWPGTLIVIATVVLNSWLVFWCATKLATYLLGRRAR